MVINKNLVGDKLKNLLKDVYGLVEATSYEQTTIYEKVSKGCYGKEWVDLDFNTRSLGVHIGDIINKTIYISIIIATYREQKIGFWYPTSEMVYYPMILDHFKKAAPHLFGKGKSLRNTDADNFHIVKQSIDDYLLPNSIKFITGRGEINEQ